MSGKVVPCRFDGKPCGRKSARGEPLCWEMWVIVGGRRKHIPRCPRVYTEEEMLEMEAEEARERGLNALTSDLSIFISFRTSSNYARCTWVHS